MAAPALTPALMDEIQRCKGEGRSKSYTADILNLSRNTVRKYWHFSPSFRTDEQEPEQTTTHYKRTLTAARKEITTLRTQLAGYRARKYGKAVKYPSVVIIPDSHAHPEYDNDRFEWLGKYIEEHKPDLIVDIGDFGDMPSLSHYDRGRRSFEGRRYLKDIEAVMDAQDRLRDAAGEAWDSAHKVRCRGNHDGERIDRLTQERPELYGLVSTDDLRDKEYGWEVYPFQVPAIFDGIAYAHYFASGVAGRPISGENIGKSLIQKSHHSCVQGHSHMFDHAERTRIDSTKLFGLSVGCYAHPGMVEGWNTATHHMWWRGIVHLQGVDGEGYYREMSSVTQSALRKRYG